MAYSQNRIQGTFRKRSPYGGNNAKLSLSRTCCTNNRHSSKHYTLKFFNWRVIARSQTRMSDFTFTYMHWRRKWQPTPVFLPGESQGWESLVGCCLWGCTESDTTGATQQQQQQQQLYLSCSSDGKESACDAGDPGSIPGSERSSGEGNGSPLQYSCLENSMGREAWQAAVHGITKSRPQLSNTTLSALLR